MYVHNMVSRQWIRGRVRSNVVLLKLGIDGRNLAILLLLRMLEFTFVNIWGDTVGQRSFLHGAFENDHAEWTAEGIPSARYL